MGGSVHVNTYWVNENYDEEFKTTRSKEFLYKSLDVKNKPVSTKMIKIKIFKNISKMESLIIEDRCDQ